MNATSENVRGHGGLRSDLLLLLALLHPAQIHVYSYFVLLLISPASNHQFPHARLLTETTTVSKAVLTLVRVLVL